MREEKSIKYDVFLSFSSSDVDAARTIYDQLVAHDLKVFWSDASLRGKLGESWFDMIEDSLELSQHLVLFITKNTFNISKWVRREYKAFLTSCYEENSRKIIPILDDDVSELDLPLFIREFQAFYISDKEAINTLGDILKERSLILQQNEEDEILPDEDPSKLKEPELQESQKEKAERVYNSPYKLGNFSDPRDNYSYKTIEIGNQVWLAENLRFNSKDSIVYKNESEIGSIYGRLYSWEAARDSCPAGWRIPDYYDWEELITKLGGYKEAGQLLVHSKAGEINAATFPDDGNSGFGAIYGGLGAEDIFGYLRQRCYFWSANEYDEYEAWKYTIFAYNKEIKRLNDDKNIYLSVRCIRRD